MTQTFTEEEIREAELRGLGPFKRYRIEEAAVLLRIEYPAARRIVVTGELEPTRVGKRVFILGGHIVRRMRVLGKPSGGNSQAAELQSSA
jgi:hypothetical protein